MRYNITVTLRKSENLKSVSRTLDVNAIMQLSYGIYYIRDSTRAQCTQCFQFQVLSNLMQK